MASWILLGILIGIFLFSTTVVCWQIIVTILEVRGILKVVRELTEETRPTLHEVNEILRKSNLAMDEAGDTYQALGENMRQARSTANKVQHKLQHVWLVARAGVERSLDVLRRGDHGGLPAVIEVQPTLPAVQPPPPPMPVPVSSGDNSAVV